MRSSESILSVGKAFCRAQWKIKPPVKDELADAGKFSYRYASLASVLECVRSPFAEEGLGLIQNPTRDGLVVTVESKVLHGESGEWMANEFSSTAAGTDPQSVGSAVTYGRRYGLMALVGIAAEDDDGAAAMPVSRKQPQPRSQAPPQPAAQPQPQEQQATEKRQPAPRGKWLARVTEKLPTIGIEEKPKLDVIVGELDRAVKDGVISADEKHQCMVLVRNRFEELDNASADYEGEEAGTVDQDGNTPVAAGA